MSNTIFDEQIDSGLCNNKDTQRVIQELVGQNLIPDNIFVLVFFSIVHHLEIIQYKFTDICYKKGRKDQRNHRAYASWAFHAK